MIKQKFLDFIAENKLFTKSDIILVGVSGGADSVFLTHLLVDTGFKIAIAHMNFKLRGQDSDKDEIFVEKLAENLKIRCFSKSVNTLKFAAKNNISIEMAARQLRYQWFTEIIEIEKFDFIATAHHQDDDIETYLINAARGTGIRGLSGISPKRKNLVRPLLFTNKLAINEYLTEKNIEFRTDRTNFENIYNRNRIRNILIPEFEKINPGFKNNILQNIRINKDIEIIYNQSIENHKTGCISENNNEIKISIEKLKILNPLRTYLFEFLLPYNFNSDVVDDIIKILDNTSGKLFYSSTHKLLKDRDFLIISKIENHDNLSEYQINELTEDVVVNRNLSDEITLKLQVAEVNSDFKIEKNTEFGYFDFDKIKFPLKIRKWQQGDSFIPYGMKNSKKVSDFFIDNKINIFDKQKVWILESDNKIIWLIGYRIDDRFKITKSTSKSLVINLLEN